MRRTVYRVVFVDEMWQLRRNETVLRRYSRQDVGVTDGRRVAQENTPSELIIHNEDGSIETTSVYENPDL